MSTEAKTSPVDPALAQRCAAVKLVVLDVDGVLTDGRLYYGADGEQLKVFHVHDGYGVRRLLRAGIRVAVISGRRSAAVERRCRELGVDTVHLGCDDKAAALASVMRAAAIEPGAVAAIGDDVPDLPMLRTAGLAIAVADARSEVLAAADWITTRPGGRGAVREVCDMILSARVPAA